MKFSILFFSSQELNFKNEGVESPVCQGLRLFTARSSLLVNKHYFDVDENEQKWPVYSFYHLLECRPHLIPCAHGLQVAVSVRERGLSLSLQHLTSPLY